MESLKDQIVRLLEEGLDDGDVMEALIIALKKTKVSSGSKSINKNLSSKSENKDLKLKSLKYYSDELGISYCDLKNAQSTYRRLNPFDYGLDAEDMVEIKKWKGRYLGDEAIFFGQLKDGKPNNFGIMVRTNGIIYEGFWKNGIENGPGRFIRNDGGFFIGEFDDGRCYNGKGYEKDGSLNEICEDGKWYSAW